jgi:hypothetical protein
MLLLEEFRVFGMCEFELVLLGDREKAVLNEGGAVGRKDRAVLVDLKSMRVWFNSAEALAGGVKLLSGQKVL